jgi:hypothetical protein
MERFAGRTERFVGRQNIEHFRAMLKTTTDPGQRKVLEKNASGSRSEAQERRRGSQTK